MRTVRALLIAVVALAGLWACGGSPAQIVDYTPLRNALNVPTTAPVTITFDHAVDQQSVASRLHLSPQVEGTMRWLDDRTVQYDHAKLRPSTTYDVIIDAGYTDVAGNTYVLRHHWSFKTEPPPTLTTSSPADGAANINPADYLAVEFSHAMNPDSLRSAISFNPDVSFNVRIDPTNELRAIVAPNALLDPDAEYTLLVTTGALDVDGNELDRVRTVRFTTGAVSALHHWVAFATLGAGGESGGIWIVNESGFPRQLLAAGAVQTFNWSPDGSRIVYESGSGTWSSYTPGSEPEALGFTGSWAAALAGGEGYAYLDSSGTLHHESADHAVDVVAAGVGGAAVSPDGRRLAYTRQQTDGTTVVWGYDVSLRSHFVLASEKGDITDPAWAPDGTRLAYLLVGETDETTLRVLGVGGSASISTIATGQLGPPAWLRDSNHVVINATVTTDTGPARKAFVLNVAAPPATLTASLGLPADPEVDVTDPTPSPDGHQIAFISDNQVWLMNADGTKPTPLTRYDQGAFPYSCLMPAWTRS